MHPDQTSLELIVIAGVALLVLILFLVLLRESSSLNRNTKTLRGEKLA